MAEQEVDVNVATSTATGSRNVDHLMSDIDEHSDENVGNNFQTDDKTKRLDTETTEETVMEAPLPKFQVNQRVDCLHTTDTADTSSLPWYDAIIRKMKLEHTIVVGTNASDNTSQHVTEEQPPPPHVKWLYLIHYQGWNSRYDQWCTEDMIRSSTIGSGSGTLPQSQLGAESSKRSELSPKGTKESPNKKRSRSMSPLPPTSTKDSIRRAKRTTKTPTNDRATAVHSAVPAIFTYTDFCRLPVTLQIVLFEEQERITGVGNNNIQSLLLHKLPGPVPIRKVLQHFVKKKIKEIRKTTIQHKHDVATDPKAVVAGANNNVTKNTTSADEGKVTSNNGSKKKGTKGYDHLLTEDIVRRFGRSLQELFEQALPKCLLYPQERSQYIDLVLPMIQDPDKLSNDGDDSRIVTTATAVATAENTNTEKKSLIDIYGCEYLLRLYVRLPMILEGTMLYTTTATVAAKSTSTSNDAMVLSSPHVLGPLLSDLLVVLQKNRTTLFPTKHNYCRGTTSTE